MLKGGNLIPICNVHTPCNHDIIEITWTRFWWIDFWGYHTIFWISTDLSSLRFIGIDLRANWLSYQSQKLVWKWQIKTYSPLLRNNQLNRTTSLLLIQHHKWSSKIRLNRDRITLIVTILFDISQSLQTQIARFAWPTWGPPGSCRPQVGPMLAPWTLLSGEWQTLPTGIIYTECTIIDAGKVCVLITCQTSHLVLNNSGWPKAVVETLSFET